MSNLRKLKLSDLQIGMSVKKEQLSEIYDTWIILVKKKNDNDYKIGFVGKETNSESAKLFKDPENIICPVFNDSIDADEDVYYEE